MGKLHCQRCGATCEKETFDQALFYIDHSVGLTNGRPCPNDGTNPMSWNGIPVGPERKEPKIPIPTKTVQVQTESKKIPQPETVKKTTQRKTR